MAEFMSYVWRWLKTALTHSLGLADLVSGIGGAVTPIIAHYFPVWAPTMNALAWQIPLWAALAVVVVRLILSPYWMAKEDAKKLAEQTLRIAQLESNKAKLKVIGPELYQEQKWANKNQWRVDVHNSGLASARNVKMRLIDVKPQPRYATWTADFPYVVNPQAASSANLIINPGDTEKFELVAGWTNSEGQIFTGGLDTKDTRNFLSIEPDERWQLTYEVVAENADTIRFSLEMYAENKSIVVRQET